MRLSIRPTLAGLLLALPVASLDAQAPTRTTPALVVAAENRTAMDAAARGAKRPDAAAHAGDVLRYKLTFTNTAGRPVRRVALQNPVAPGLQFVAGSARTSREDARAEYSVDNGATWSTRPMETVVIDGKRVERDVAPERFTGVRWMVDGWVTPGATVTAQFEARLPARTSSAIPAGTR